jgi:hypothetical protein
MAWQSLWNISIIPATWDADVRAWFKTSLGKKGSYKDSTLKNKAWGYIYLIPATWEV